MAERTDSGERNYPPSALRLQEARDKGQVARSADVVSAAVMLGGIVALGGAGRGMLDGMVRMMSTLLQSAGGRATAEIGQSAWIAAQPVVGGAAAIALAAAGAAVVAGGVQGGMRLTMENASPKWERLDPVSGLGRMLSRRSLVRSALAVGKIAVVAVVAYTVFRAAMPAIVGSGAMSLGAVSRHTGELVLGLCGKVGVALLALAGVDYLYQRWELMQDLRMTRREYLDDIRRSEGDGQVRRRRKQVAQDRATAQAAAAAPCASIVIAAPGGPAVALRCGGGLRRPRVVAKGQSRTAECIRRSAAQRGVPVAEDAVLASVLAARCRVGSAIPESQARAVAEILQRPENTFHSRENHDN